MALPVFASTGRAALRADLPSAVKVAHSYLSSFYTPRPYGRENGPRLEPLLARN